ncbi:MAG TPA: efflux RND transporter periplasmic adaptor subunit, partial [Polyangia bacterium]|nr:efflux RND transporter periplasmic adaptor subunit [Polyangia bacterium]
RLPQPAASAVQPAAAPTPAPKPSTPAPAPAPAAATDPSAASAGNASPFLSGTTEAHRKSTLTPKVSSAVTRVHVREGDMVKQGQPLVTLDTRDFILRSQQAEAARDGARVQLDAAKLDWTRIQSLLAEKAVPQSQFDMIDARFKGAKAGLAAAETAVAMGQKALHDSVVRAPFDGLVVKRFVNEGEYASVMPATQLVTIEEIDPVDLRIQVPSSDMAQVAVGSPVHVRLPATGQEMDLRLTRVVSSSDPRTRTFSAIVEIPNPNHSLRSGLYAEVSLRPRGGSSATATEIAKTKKRARSPRN